MRVFLSLPRIPKKRPLNLMAASSSTKPSARVYLQVLGTETKDTSPSLFLFADSQRYSHWWRVSLAPTSCKTEAGVFGAWAGWAGCIIRLSWRGVRCFEFLVRFLWKIFFNTKIFVKELAWGRFNHCCVNKEEAIPETNTQCCKLILLLLKNFRGNYCYTVSLSDVLP